MSEIIVVTFAHKRFLENQIENAIACEAFGADRVISLNLESLEVDEEMKSFIDSPENKRGVGFYTWKPHCIKQALNSSSEGDVVIYMDSGTLPSKDLRLFATKVRENGVFGFLSDHLARKYTKKSIVEYFGEDYSDWQHSETGGLRRQNAAGFIGIRNGDPIAMQLIDKWAEIMVPRNKNIFDDSKEEGLHSDFVASRHDQMVFDLCVRHILGEASERRFGVMYDAVSRFGLLYHSHYPGRKG